MEQTQGLNKSLSFVHVYALATGAIFTFVAYWDTTFVSYCGPATWLAFLTMTIAVLPIAFTYCEITPFFPQAGAELIYNTVAYKNKYIGFFSAWAIMMAWIAVPPAAVMAIIEWVTNIVFDMALPISTITIIGIALLCVYCFISLQNIEIAGSIQTVMLVGAIIGCLGSAIGLIFMSGTWSFDNMKPFFKSTLADGEFGGWCIGLALIITPYFGFETVPQLVEEANFPIQYATKAIWGSVVTCGVVYTILFFGIAGVTTWENILFIGGDPANGEVSFLTITAMENLLGWTVWPLIYGFFGVFCAIGTCLLGFWVSAVRLLYAMGNANYLPKSFAKVNKHHQPIVPNVLLLVISVVFLCLQNGTTFVKDFFNLMAFGCGLTYAITSVGAMRIKKVYPHWVSPYKLPGGAATRVIACIVAILVCIGTCIGQGPGSWISFGVYMGIGAVLVVIQYVTAWSKGVKVKWQTPDGEMEF